MIASMNETYFKLIKAGRRTIDTIPEQHRASVQAMLDADEAATSEPAAEAPQ